MKSTLNLSIPSACSEKWENFESRSEGGFCRTCSKTVVDFTRMSDDQVIDFFRNKPEHACGRLRIDQLRSYTLADPMRINPGFRLFRAGLLSLFLLLAGKVVTAQPVVKKQPVEMVQTTDRKVGEVNVRQTGFVVKGVVKDKNSQESIPGVNVLLKGTEIGTITDADGRFTFPRALNPGNVLIVDFIGYEAQEYVVPQDFKAAEILLPISMKASNIILGGICYRPSLPRRLWLKIKSIF